MKLEEEKKKIQSPVDSTQFLQINHKNQYNAKISTNIKYKQYMLFESCQGCSYIWRLTLS